MSDQQRRRVRRTRAEILAELFNGPTDGRLTYEALETLCGNLSASVARLEARNAEQAARLRVLERCRPPIIRVGGGSPLPRYDNHPYAYADRAHGEDLTHTGGK